ncbi:putative signal peptide-containing protein, partial [Cryptosporidium canis]
MVLDDVFCSQDDPNGAGNTSSCGDVGLSDGDEAPSPVHARRGDCLLRTPVRPNGRCGPAPGRRNSPLSDRQGPSAQNCGDPGRGRVSRLGGGALASAAFGANEPDRSGGDFGEIRESRCCGGIPASAASLGVVVLLLVAHAVFGGECQGLGIYSTLPDHIVDWLKRHILVEISQVGCHLADGRTEDLAEGGRRCSSVTGPYCRHLSRVSAVSGHDLETANYIYDHEGGTGCFNRDFFLGKSAYGLFGASENATTHPESTEAVESFRSASRARLHDTAAMQRYCKLTRGNFLYCFKLILRSYCESLTRGLAQAGLVSRLLSSWRAFLRAAQDFRYLKGGSRRRRSASRASWRKNEIFTVVHDFALPPLHPDYLGREGERAPSPEASSPYRKDVYFQVRSNFLFDETLSSFLRSRYVRMNLVSGLTWILQQTTPYLGIWRNKRAERLSRHYILADHPETHSCGGFSVSPYNGLKVCSDLLLGDFQSKFRVIRRAWNGVSSMMSFSGLRPNVRILPAEFSSDAQLTCEWEGLWEVHQDRTLAIRLLSRFGKLRVTNEKMVVSRLPVSISNMSPDKTSMDDAKVVTISGYSHSRLMW